MSEAPPFTLANVGDGPEEVSLSELSADNDVVVLLLQRDYYCMQCRDQIQAVAERYEDFRERGAEVVSIAPESPRSLAGWQEKYELPYPLLADPGSTVGDEMDQPVRFGLLGRFSDLFGRMPAAVLLDCRDGDPSVAWAHRGRSTWDRPSVDDLLDRVDDLLAGDLDGDP